MKMRRSPKEVVDTLAYSLKEGKPGDVYKISDIVKITSLNHVTTMYYLDLVMRIQNNLPKIEIVEMKRNSYIKILEAVEFPWSEEEQMLISLFDKGAFNKKTAASVNKGSINILEKLNESSLVAHSTEKAYLLPEGIIAAALLADKRAEDVLGPTKHKLYDSGEIKIEPYKWRILDNVKTAAEIGKEDLTISAKEGSIGPVPLAI